MSTLYKPLENGIGCMRMGNIIKKINSITSEISFSDSQKSYCVGVVDIVDSTSITASLSHDKMCEYYGIFLNSMSKIAKEFGAVIVKNIGDSLLYYFPTTCDAEDPHSLHNVLECSISMIESNHDVNKLMYEYDLPPVSYRVSSDYGKIAIARSQNSVCDDIFGPTVSICSKINEIAAPNSIVVGGDLYQVTRSFRDYKFHSLYGLSVGMRLDYPVYSLSRKRSDS